MRAARRYRSSFHIWSKTVCNSRTGTTPLGTTRCFGVESSKTAPVEDAATRFSSRVADYVASRPSYPPDVVSLLSSHFNLKKNATIVDIGSGTGISSSLLLQELKELHAKVIGVEPNKEMREAGEQLLSLHKENGSFTSVDGTAESTGLEENSVDLIVAAQAFHWFDVPKAREECKRILKTNGNSGVALIWNDRRGLEPIIKDPNAFPELNSPVMSAYDLLLVRRGQNYEKVSSHKAVDEAMIKSFFGPAGFEMATFTNPYLLDYEQLKGRLLSSSYTPREGEKGYSSMMQELGELFEKYQKDGKIDFVYDTRVFYGAMS